MAGIYIYIALTLALLMAGCSAPPKTEEQQGANTRTASNTAPTATNTAPATTEPKGTVEVKLTEFKIEMPTSVAAGATTIKVTNAGKDTHSFEVEGNGIETELETKLKAGESGMLQVDLKPGTYHVYCPVDGHKKLGMSLNLTVK
jgi:uncharacterized cupredoxin-like copper-binding protein